MEYKIQIDPFRYGILDILTTMIQVVTVIAEIVLALGGNSTGLLALGALAGGGKTPMKCEPLSLWERRESK